MVDDDGIQDIYKKGIEAFRRGELQNASNLLIQVVEASEEDHRAWNALGVVFTKMGKYEDAEVCFENALTLDPSNEVYKRNQEKNRSHIKKSVRDQLSSLPVPRLSDIPFWYRILGIAGVIAGIVILALLLLPVLNPSPLSVTAGDISVFIDSTEDLVFIKNQGGPGLDRVQQFDITINNQSLGTLVQIGGTLGTYEGSSIAIPIDDLYPVSVNNEVTCRVTAVFNDNSSRLLLARTLSLPVLEEEPVVEEPVIIPPHNPLYSVGDVLLRRENGTYILITGLLPDNQYRIEELIRRNDGQFMVQPGLARNVSMPEYEMLYQKAAELPVPADTVFRPGTPYQARSVQSSSKGRNPLYGPGDLISRTSGRADDILVILGYDPATDEYATDTIYPYYTGEWGYRPDTKAEWMGRAEVEGAYPARVNRIALSQIGIGADSSPPGTEPVYREGDIIAEDRSADAGLLLILAYNPKTGEYSTDVIRSSYDGGWVRDGQNISKLRSALEREYPYKVRNVDVSLVKIR